jgi:hypothetical protein
MTEEQAKTKWCPQTHMKTLWDASVRDGERDPNWPFRCIGSACMAWQWRLRGTSAHGDKLYSTNDGYCGLAGAPQ